jgi:hypothetical protein
MGFCTFGVEVLAKQCNSNTKAHSYAIWLLLCPFYSDSQAPLRLVRLLDDTTILAMVLYHQSVKRTAGPGAAR